MCSVKKEGSMEMQPIQLKKMTQHLVTILIQGILFSLPCHSTETKIQDLSFQLSFSQYELENSKTLHSCQLVKISNTLENICIDFDIDYSDTDRVLFASNLRLQTERLQNNYLLELSQILLNTSSKNIFFDTQTLVPHEKINTIEDIGFFFKSGYIQTQLEDGNEDFKLELQLNIRTTDLGRSNQDTLYKPMTVDPSVNDIFKAKNQYCALQNGQIFCWGLKHQFRTIVKYPDFNKIFTVPDDPNITFLSYSNDGKAICLKYRQEDKIEITCAVNENFQSLKSYLLEKSKPQHVLGTEEDPVLKVLQLWSSRHGACAVFKKARIKCWGSEYYEGIGFNSNLIPPDDLSIQDVSEYPYIELGASHLEIISIAYQNRSFCALLSNGRLKCWGMNRSGEIGKDPTSIPLVKIHPNNLNYLDLGPKKVRKLINDSQNKHDDSLYCIQYMTNEYKCWGSNHYGALGTYLLKGSFEKTKPSYTSDISTVPNLDFGKNKLENSILRINKFNLCIMFQFGKFKCWGNNNIKTHTTNINQKELLSSSDYFLNTDAHQSTKIMKLGKESFYSIDDKNHFYFWNNEQIYKYLTYNKTYKFKSTDLGNSQVKKIYNLYEDTVCILFIDGIIKCWGKNYRGLLGPKNKYETPQPEHIDDNKSLELGEHKIVELYSYLDEVACALFENGKVKCWGSNSNESLGQPIQKRNIGTKDGDFRNLDYIYFDTNLRAIEVHHVDKHEICVEFADYSLKCWGNNQGMITNQSPERHSYGSRIHAMKNLNFIRF